MTEMGNEWCTGTRLGMDGRWWKSMYCLVMRNPLLFSSCYFNSLHLHTLKVHRSFAIHPMIRGSLYHCKPHQPGTYHFQQVALIS